MKSRLSVPVVLIMLVALNTHGQDQDPLNRDEDFQFQGEYLGTVLYEAATVDNAGLQVIARGAGMFDAVLFRGGLPGANWNMQDWVTLSGERQGDTLSLSGEDHHVEIEGGFEGKHWVTDGTERPIWKINRRSGSLGAAPTYGATVLFDGTTNRFRKAGDPSQPAETSDGLLHEGSVTEMPVGDFYLHLEFRTPYMPDKSGQARGNSGVYIQRRYEVQILDSFGLSGATNECGGLYGVRRPDLNMCLPPLSWQTYDIYFNAARFDAHGNKLANATITVLHNDVMIQQDVQLPGKTGGGRAEGPEKLEILLQNHGPPVRFRNIWYAPRDEYIVGPIIAPPARSNYIYYQQRRPWPLYHGRPPFPYPPYMGLQSGY